MSEFESKFNPGFEFLDDPEIRDLQALLDDHISNLVSQQGRNTARNEFPHKLRQVAISVRSSPRRVKFLMQFLQSSIRMNNAGGIGKDIRNPIIAAINEVNKSLVEQYPDIFQQL